MPPERVFTVCTHILEDNSFTQQYSYFYLYVLSHSFVLLFTNLEFSLVFSSVFWCFNVSGIVFIVFSISKSYVIDTYWSHFTWEFVYQCGQIFVKYILFILFLFNCNYTFSKSTFNELYIAFVKVVGMGCKGQKYTAEEELQY